jgi:hypothetical protein
MKKIILTAAAVFAFSFANAQDLTSKKGEPYLPEAGDWAIGFNADNLFDYVGNAFSGKTNNTIGSVGNNGWNGTFVGKKFTSATKADRYLVDFGVNTGSTTTPTGPTTEIKSSTSGFNLAVGLGKEWRKGKTRLQGFYGADLVLGLSSNGTKTEFTDSATPASNITTKFTSGLGFNVGARGFLGAEYFIFPKIAIGAQYTYNVSINVAGASKTTTTTPVTSTETKGGSSFGLGIGNVGVASMNLTLHF